MPVMNVLFDPNRLWIAAKKNTWKNPFRIPNTERTLPMLAGFKPSPPSSIGVDKKTGWIARNAISTRERKA
jgi:hypothetical protein